jgi:ribose transport system substrate-binding protein
MADELIKGKQPSQKSIEVPLFAVTPANLGSVNKTNMQAPKGWTPGT